MESISESKTYNPQEEIKKFWPSQSDSVVDEYKEISLVAMPNSPQFESVREQLRKWSALGIIRPFLMVDAEKFVFQQGETEADTLRKECEFVFPSFFSSIDDNTKLINPLFPYLSDLGQDLNQIRFLSVLSPDKAKGTESFFNGIRVLKDTLEKQKNQYSIRLFTSRLLIPSSRWLDDKNRNLDGLIYPDANINLLVAPEDRPSPGAVNQGVLDDNFVSHTSFYIATAANLWIGSKETTFDNFEPNLQGEEDFRVIRGYGRLVVSGDIVERVAKGIKDDTSAYRSPHPQLENEDRVAAYIEKISTNFFESNIKNKDIVSSPDKILRKTSNFKSYLDFLVTRFRLNANKIFYTKNQLENSTLKDEVQNLENVDEIKISDEYLNGLAEGISIQRNERLNEDSEIYKEYMDMLIAEVDGSDTYIEDHVESKYYRLLNSKSIVGQEDSLVSEINLKIQLYKNSLTSSFMSWFKLFFKELKKDVDGSVEKLLKKLKILRIFEILALTLSFSNVMWLVLTRIYEGAIEIEILGRIFTIPDYLPAEGSYIFLGSAVVFIASTATGFIQKNKVFGSSLTIYEIKENIENILIEFYNLNRLIEHLSDWSEVAHETIEKPFIDSGPSLKSLNLLRDIETKSKAFQIAEGEINEVVINNISNKYVKIGWMKELFQKTLESFKTWTIEQNLAFGSTLDFNKKLFKDVSNLPTVGPRRKIREYADSGFITINGRKSLEAFIEKELGGVKTSEIFSKNITIVEDRGEKSSDVDKFFGDLTVEHKWDREFLSGVWTNVKLVNEPENVVVDTTAISGKQESENSAVQYMDLEIAVKAGTPVQSLYLRVDLSKPQKPSAVGEWNRSTLSNEFKELDQTDNEIY